MLVNSSKLRSFPISPIEPKALSKLKGSTPLTTLSGGKLLSPSVVIVGGVAIIYFSPNPKPTVCIVNLVPSGKTTFLSVINKVTLIVPSGLISMFSINPIFIPPPLYETLPFTSKSPINT